MLSAKTSLTDFCAKTSLRKVFLAIVSVLLHLHRYSNIIEVKPVKSKDEKKRILAVQRFHNGENARIHLRFARKIESLAIQHVGNKIVAICIGILFIGISHRRRAEF